MKRYSKRLLVQIKKDEMYKILIERAFTEDEDSSFKKLSPIKSTIFSGGQYIIEIYKRGDIRNVP